MLPSGESIMRFNGIIKTFVLVAFALWFVVLGFAEFVRVGNSGQKFDDRMQTIRAGKIQPEPLVAIKKYVNPGKNGPAHVVFSGSRQAKADLAVTRDFFNSVNLGDTVPGYYFPDSYFIPQNHTEASRSGRWFFLGFGILTGAAALALAYARARRPNARSC